MIAHIKDSPWAMSSATSACGAALGKDDLLIGQGVAGGILFGRYADGSPLRKITAQQLCEHCLNALHAQGAVLYHGR